MTPGKRLEASFESWCFPYDTTCQPLPRGTSFHQGSSDSPLHICPDRCSLAGDWDWLYQRDSSCHTAQLSLCPASQPRLPISRKSGIRDFAESLLQSGTFSVHRPAGQRGSQPPRPLSSVSAKWSRG